MTGFTKKAIAKALRADYIEGLAFFASVAVELESENIARAIDEFDASMAMEDALATIDEKAWEVAEAVNKTDRWLEIWTALLTAR